MTENNMTGYRLAGALAVILVLIIYSNTIHSPWILDDYHNIVDNPRIQIGDVSINSIKGSLYSYIADSKKLYRPVACFTFALNALAGGKDTTGYHIVNIAIHAAVSIALIRLLIMVFRPPALEKIPENEKKNIVILSAVMWAVHPVQTQAVTYIVQRMAMLCTLFAIIALIFFIKARLSDNTVKKASYYSGFILSFILSMLSKENGIIIIPLAFCIEFFLFRNGDCRILTKRVSMAFLLFFILAAVFLFFYTSGFAFLHETYEKRPFTMYERILTQPGILLYYLSLIFYPLPQRFSLEHDVAIPPGFFSSPQTMMFTAIIIFIIAACIISKKIPLPIRLSVVFFFIAHSVESSILPLELIFEHRNYLPSIFLFMPFAFGINRILAYYSSQKRYMKSIVYCFITALIFMTGMSTYTRNLDWSSEERIWSDAMIKAPGNARPKQSLGFVTGMKNPDKALYYYSQALTGYMHEPKEEKASTLANMGFIYFHLKNFGQAVRFFQMAVDILDNHLIAHNGLIQSYMNKAQWDMALEAIDRTPNTQVFNRLKAACFLYKGNYDKALELFGEVYRNRPFEDENILNLAEAFSISGFYDRADFFYAFYLAKHRSEPEIYLRLSKNSYLKGDMQKASEYLKKFFMIAGAEKTGSLIINYTGDITLPVAGFEKMKDYISKEFMDYKKSINLIYKSA